MQETRYIEGALSVKMGMKRKEPRRPMKKKQTLSRIKKATWDVFSRFVRLRDCLRTTGCTSWGLCITCGKRYHFKLLQAGHFIPGRHSANLFSEKGVHAQCYNCNINLKGNTLEYRRQIIKLYGEGYDEVLEQEERQVKKYTIPELEELQEQLQEKIKVLEE